MTQAPTASPVNTDATKKAADPSANVVIKCVGLSKTFKDFWLRDRVRAVDTLNLEVREGEVFGLLGPNGSGKSTTIKMILGLLNPTQGRIAIFGRHPQDVKNKNQIGYLPEETYLYPFLNAYETLDYYGRLFHQNSATRGKRIETLLEMVGLDKVARRPIGEYSKGMQRRIGLAQALINDPQLLILDEPTSGLDPIGTADVKRTIQTLANRGKTILLCSHLLADVQDVCDRVCIMYGGKIREEGNLDTLLQDTHKTTIEADELDDETIAEIEAVLQRRGKAIERVDRPKKSLESLFLDMVDRERNRGTATDGAQETGQIAAFLRDGENEAIPEELEGAAVLSQLVGGDEPEEPAVETAAAAAETTEAGLEKEQVESGVLSELLTNDSESTNAVTEQNESAPAASTDSPKPDDNVDRSVLDSLLGGDDDKKN